MISESPSSSFANLTGIAAVENSTLDVQNSSLTVRTNATTEAEAYGIDTSNSSVIVQNCSFDISANTSTGNASAIGINSLQSNITADHDTFNITSNAPNGKATSWGIFNAGGSAITQSNNQFTIIHTGQTTAGGDVGP